MVDVDPITAASHTLVVGCRAGELLKAVGLRTAATVKSSALLACADKHPSADPAIKHVSEYHSMAWRLQPSMSCISKSTKYWG